MCGLHEGTKAPKGLDEPLVPAEDSKVGGHRYLLTGSCLFSAIKWCGDFTGNHGTARPPGPPMPGRMHLPSLLPREVLSLKERVHSARKEPLWCSKTRSTQALPGKRFLIPLKCTTAAGCWGESPLPSPIFRKPCFEGGGLTRGDQVREAPGVHDTH